MNLVIDFGDKGVMVDTINQHTKQISMKELDKYSKPLYVVDAKEVYTGDYFILEKIDNRHCLAIDKKFKLIIIEVSETNKCNKKYSYKLIGSTCKKYTNSVEYRSNKFNSQLGHIEYMHGFKNVSNGIAVKVNRGFEGTLVDGKVINGVFHARYASAKLYAQFKDKIVSIEVNPVYNYRNLDLNFKYDALLVGKYYKKLDLSQVSDKVLNKLLNDNKYISFHSKNLELEYNDLNYTNNTITAILYKQRDKLKAYKEAYVYSNKYSNVSNAIAMHRVTTSNAITYYVIRDTKANYITLQEMVEGDLHIDNVSITDEYVEIVGIDGHYRYNIKEYYEYYKLNFAEKSDKYKTQKMLKSDIIENVRENGDLDYIKMDTHTLEIPVSCKHIKNSSIEVSPSNRILYIPSSVKYCDASPFNSTRFKYQIEEVIIECNPSNIIPSLLDLTALDKHTVFSIKVDRLDEYDILSIYNLNTPVKLQLTDKSYKLSKNLLSRTWRLIKASVTNDLSVSKYTQDNEVIQVKIDILRILVTLIDDTESIKQIKKWIESFEKLKI